MWLSDRLVKGIYTLKWNCKWGNRLTITWDLGAVCIVLWRLAHHKEKTGKHC